MARLTAEGSWLGESGPESDIVLSSRVRLARNIAGVSFVNRASDPDRNEIVGMVRRAPLFATSDSALLWMEMDDLTERDRQLLVERHLISLQFADDSAPRGVAISRDETLSVMVNEEDHLRIQTMRSGLSLADAHTSVTAVANELEQELDFAFSPRWGFLTACPSNIGCGVRFSVMLHLPALRVTEEFERVRRAAKDLCLAVRGFHGEGTEATGDFFQVSNQVTLGVTEEELLEQFAGEVVPQLVEYERSARSILLNTRRVQLEDTVFRALGTLTSARMLESNEAIKLLSRVRLGVNLDLIKGPSIALLHRLLLQVQPAHLCSITGVSLEDESSARTARATLVRAGLDSELNS